MLATWVGKNCYIKNYISEHQQQIKTRFKQILLLVVLKQEIIVTWIEDAQDLWQKLRN